MSVLLLLFTFFPAKFVKAATLITLTGDSTQTTSFSGELSGLVHNLADDTIIDLDGYDLIFQTFSAGDGGVFYIDGKNLTIDGGNAIFKNNTAPYGGAIYNYDNSDLTITG
ncbi:MAG: hypothetical protein LBT46_03590, partial [Planctomycetaceae bacterium]|nr:hypothetical protein [Planctomycetaceae bacterium]